MKVLKFGGTSVGTVESLGNVKAIVEACTQPVVVVVSALGGVTNKLIECTQLALERNDDYSSLLEQLRQRHLNVAKQVVSEPEKQQMCIGTIENFFDHILTPMLFFLYANPDLPSQEVSRIKDAIVSHGEIMSSAIVTCMLHDADAIFAPEMIKTERDNEGTHRLCSHHTHELIKEQLGQYAGTCIVTQGFISKDIHTHDITNLGRGGSDFTAALIAAALDAECLEIWTDVDGFMTADPRTHPDATVIPTMTYEQAQAMCDAGAKVIYAPTLHPVAQKHIPVWVKNTFNPQAPGTVIK